MHFGVDGGLRRACIRAGRCNSLLCRNDNCITRTVTEDVPPKFYSEEGVIRCRYRRRT